MVYISEFKQARGAGHEIAFRLTEPGKLSLVSHMLHYEWPKDHRYSHLTIETVHIPFDESISTVYP